MIALDHVRLDVSDIEASARFYREALGLVRLVAYRTETADILQLVVPSGSGGVELWHEADHEPRPDGRLHVSFKVDDVDAVIAHAASLGVEPAQAPFNIKEERVAFLQDPDGYLIELNDFRGRPTLAEASGQGASADPDEAGGSR